MSEGYQISLASPVKGRPVDKANRLHWLSAGCNALVRYVIRQRMAAARREIRRGRARLWIRPDGD